jgi:hypothetical protein
VETDQGFRVATIQLQPVSSWWKSWRFWLLAALAAQYVILQLATGVEYLDAQRNMQWGRYVFEQPNFLLGAVNSYDRIKGFPPSPAALAPAGYVIGRSGTLSPWWGPLYLALFGGVWWLTHSYTAMQLIGPIAAGVAVLLTYAFGKRFFDRRVGWVAAILLALFPTYREHAVLALVEPLAALLITGAFWALLDRRSWLAALLGALAMLGKPDAIAMYYGTIILTALLSWRDPDHPFSIRHLIICLGVPLLAILPWFYAAFVLPARSTILSGGPNLTVFLTIMPLMFDQFFMLGRYATLLICLPIVAAVFYSLTRRQGARPLVYRMLVVWFGLGMTVVLGYASLPDASNNPRVLIPALPALCLLIADGLLRMRWFPSKLALSYILTMFIISDAAGLYYQLLQARATSAMMPVWDVLRAEPRGFVLTDAYWDAALYARQPATWFEHDAAFQHAIMHNLNHFQSYIAGAPIRYIVLPRDQQVGPAYTYTAAVQFYEQLPIGRDLGWVQQPLAAPEVRAFLEQTFPKRLIGDYVIFTLDEQATAR